MPRSDIPWREQKTPNRSWGFVGRIRRRLSAIAATKGDAMSPKRLSSRARLSGADSRSLLFDTVKIERVRALRQRAPSRLQKIYRKDAKAQR
jgi:hypothetical protein